MKRSTMWMRSILFVLIFSLFYLATTAVMIPKTGDMWQSGRVIDGFYHAPKQSIDLLTLGSSQVLVGFSAMDLYKRNGYAAYSLATENQTMFASYYLLMECLRYNQPQVLILEVQQLFGDTTEPFYHKIFDNMPWSSVKWEAVTDYIQHNPDSSLMNFLVPLVVFHDRWKDIRLDDLTYFFHDRYDPLRGFVMLHDRSQITDFSGIADSSESQKSSINFVKDEIEYFDKIKALCGEEGIQIILLKNPTTLWTQEDHDAVAQYAADKQLIFLDMNETAIIQQIDFHFADDAHDKGHLNVIGTEKVCAYLSVYLKEHTMLQDRRGNPAYAFLEKDLVTYEKMMAETKALMGKTLDIPIKDMNKRLIYKTCSIFR